MVVTVFSFVTHPPQMMIHFAKTRYLYASLRWTVYSRNKFHFLPKIKVWFFHHRVDSNSCWASALMTNVNYMKVGARHLSTHLKSPCRVLIHIWLLSVRPTSMSMCKSKSAWNANMEINKWSLKICNLWRNKRLKENCKRHYPSVVGIKCAIFLKVQLNGTLALTAWLALASLAILRTILKNGPCNTTKKLMTNSSLLPMT